MSVPTATDRGPNVQEMTVIHRVFRRELVMIPRLVRAIDGRNTDRVRLVGEHIEFLLAFLHAHHSGEDELLWPRLLDRAAPSAGLVHTMQEQHARVEQYTGAAGDALRQWVGAPATATGDRLAGLVDELRAALVTHLDLEEQEILPLISRYITVEEWALLAEHGKNAMPRKQLPLVFGAMLEDADPAERAELLAAVPAPIRFFLRTAGARQYRRYITRLRTG
ncbi:hemerythrin domain-containing protein [Dactylosporangium sp. NPDC005572]|uniref:hemerythrin domain-containing protein n=1 Tax=Dactylosporangium sp. NPDC005572 TaxID=3156889 RepID=UPI0033ABDA93